MPPTIPGIENIPLPNIGNMVVYMGYILLVILCGAAFMFLMHITSFKYKVILIPLFGGVENKTFSIGRRKINRVKWDKSRTAWKPLFPLFNKKQKQPFKDNYIYPGKQVYAFELGDTWIPASLEITKDERNSISAKINPVPFSVRAWQSMEHRRNAEEFAKQGFWEQNKQLFITLGTILLCCILCGAVIYFTYKFAGGGRADIKALTDAIRGFADVPGVAPS